MPARVHHAARRRGCVAGGGAGNRRMMSALPESTDAARAELSVRVCELLMDQNAVIVRDARNEDRSLVEATVHLPAVRRQCAASDADIATAILERTLPRPGQLQPTVVVRNPSKEDGRVVKGAVDPAARGRERASANLDVVAALLKTARTLSPGVPRCAYDRDGEGKE